jgi:hypothetical protein
VEFARLVKAFNQKGVKLSQIARVANLALAHGSFVVFDGCELRPHPDAETAIAAVTTAKGPCSAVDMSAIRTAAAEKEVR